MTILIFQHLLSFIVSHVDRIHGNIVLMHKFKIPNLMSLLADFLMPTILHSVLHVQKTTHHSISIENIIFDSIILFERCKVQIID